MGRIELGISIYGLELVRRHEIDDRYVTNPWTALSTWRSTRDKICWNEHRQKAACPTDKSPHSENPCLRHRLRVACKFPEVEKDI